MIAVLSGFGEQTGKIAITIPEGRASDRPCER